ncbi:MAG: Rieske 2Fe-2S domain-containing protein [Chloroflexota bacterium]
MSDQPKTLEELLAEREAWLSGASASQPEVDAVEEEAVVASAEVEEALPAPITEAEPAPVAQAEVVEEKPDIVEETPAVATTQAAMVFDEKPENPEDLIAQREAWLSGSSATQAIAPAANKEAAASPPPVKKAEPAQKPVAQPEAVEAKPPVAATKPEAAKKVAPVAEKPAAAKKAPAKKAAPAKKKAGKKKAAPFVRPANVTRREFLNLAWLGSIALLTVQTLGISILFAFPRFKEGDFGGIIRIGNAASRLPEVNAPPVPFASGKFWLTNTPEGAYAIYQVCTHLGCLYAWSDVTSRFECPCHGSKFSLDGSFIEGPAPRSLDRFPLIALDDNGNEIARTPESGGGLPLNGDEDLVVDTGGRIQLAGTIDASTLT